MAAVSTTYGVGELSAINGIAGSCAEHLAVFHLVGMPSSGLQAEHRLMHHTLGTGEFDLFHNMTEPVVCARAIMTPENYVAETERLIAAALYHRQPVYMAFSDVSLARWLAFTRYELVRAHLNIDKSVLSKVSTVKTPVVGP
jgi:indolepyruvate decarboxylase